MSFVIHIKNALLIVPGPNTYCDFLSVYTVGKMMGGGGMGGMPGMGGMGGMGGGSPFGGSGGGSDFDIPDIDSDDDDDDEMPDLVD